VELPTIVSVENLSKEPYASVLCYPKASKFEIQKRLMELQKHGVTSLEFVGNANAFNVPVLGKGFVGMVVVAHLSGERIALKIRRVDADRLGLQHESRMLRRANAVQVGPRFRDVSRNFLLMELIEGAVLPEWSETQREKTNLRNVLNDVLEQCWRLDNAGLDHGELSKAPKHVIVDNQQKPWIVDFETASVNRKTANLTSICQFMFVSGSKLSRTVDEILEKRQKEEIIHALRLYKKDKTLENFHRVKQICLS
jgi:putative serine/threonine protein kinase